MDQLPEEVLQILLQHQQTHELSIIRLSEPIKTENVNAAPHEEKRRSDASADAQGNPSPASLEADLQHYKELFSKLRFSYLEQVTKEKFLRAIVGDPPLVVDQQENVELETELVDVKASLQTQKAEVAEMVEELERQGRELCRRYQTIQLQTAQLQSLPDEIEGLRHTIASLAASQAPKPTNPSLSLSLPATKSILADRQAELQILNEQLSMLKSTVPSQARELQRLESELQQLEMQKTASTTAAKEARRRREESLAGLGDDIEERGRWYRAVEVGLREMLEV